MKRTIQKTFCDDCGKEIPSDKSCTTIEIIKHKSQLGDTIGVMMDFCWGCLTHRINHSIQTKPMIMCNVCGGKGRIKELVSFHNDSPDYVQCSKCKGKGII
jgi:hypothetical protein